MADHAFGSDDLLTLGLSRISRGIFVSPARRLGGLTLLVAAWGCQSKMTVETKSGGPKAPAVAITSTTTETTTSSPTSGNPTKAAGVLQEGANIVIPVKQVYQSGEVVRVRISNALIGNAPSLSMMNVTGFTADNEGNATVLVDKAAVPTALGLTEDAGFELAGSSSGVTLTRDSDGVVIAINPNVSELKKLIKYGLNKLKIIANDPAEERFTYTTITLKDFDILGPTYLGRPGDGPSHVGQAADGSKFQGWLNVLSPPLVTVKDAKGNASGTLAHGVFNIIN